MKLYLIQLFFILFTFFLVTKSLSPDIDCMTEHIDKIQQIQEIIYA